MKKTLVAALVAVGTLAVPALTSTGCGGGGTGGGTGGSGGGSSGTGGGSSGTGGGTTAVQLDTVARVQAFLEGKKLVMEGANSPSHPNGLNENVYFGASTQCYKKTTINVASNNFNVTADLGTWRSLDGGTPANGTLGTCDRTVISAPFTANSMSVLIANVQGNATCFDVDVTYNAYGQEGRGAIDVDAGTVKMELFFKNGAVNMRCADGVPGATGVKQVVMGTQYPFAGNAVQTYVITP